MYAWGTNGPSLDSIGDSVDTVLGIPATVAAFFVAQSFVLGTASVIYFALTAGYSKWAKR